MFDSCEEVLAALTEVVGQDAGALDADELLTRLSTISQLESVLAAAKAETMVGFHRELAGVSADLGHDSPRPGDRPASAAERRWSGDVLRSVSDEIGLVLGAHRRTAARWINRAAVLVERFAATHELLAKGGLPAAAAQTIAHELAVIANDELRAGVEKVVLAWGLRYGWVRIKRTAQREAAKALAEYESLLHAQRLMERTTYTVSHDGGMADLVVSTSAVDVTAIMAALTARAVKLQRQGDQRSLDELRTDLAVSRLLGEDAATEDNAEPACAAADTAPGAASPNRSSTEESRGPVPPESGMNPAVGAQVVIHCSYEEAEALATGAIATGGELEGYGILPQDALAMAFRKAKFRYRLTNRVPKSDPASYEPSPGLAEHVRDRDRRCRFPGCNARVKYCDLDHRVPFPDGCTDADNLEPLCREHHRLKHRGNWQVFKVDDGSLVWISPSGRAHVDPPPALPGAA
jgi:hypothetical protein